MQRIDGNTMLAGVVGHPVAHSLSPVMHNAAYAELGLNWAYLPLGLPDEVALRRFIALAPSLNLVGFNVTMPYKRAMLELCDEVAMTAQMAGAVNTVHLVDGRLVGYNTDGRGLLESLEHDAGFTPTGKTVVILGTGGAAGGAFVAFLLGRAARVTIVSREAERADALLSRMASHLRDVDARAMPLASAHSDVTSADLIVNATPLGMGRNDASPLPAEWLSGGQIVFDMVYGVSWPTALKQAAEAADARYIDGLGMLVSQGATTIDIWNTEQTPAPRDVMRAAALEMLAARARAERHL